MRRAGARCPRQAETPRGGARAGPDSEEGGLGWVMLAVSTRGLSCCAVSAQLFQQSLCSAGRPSACLVGTEEQTELGGGFRS